MATLQENVKAMLAAGVPEEEIGKYIQSYGGGQGETPQREQPAPEGRTWGQTFSEAAKNAPKSAAKFLKDVGGAVMHPIDTAEALGRVGSGIVQQTKNPFIWGAGGVPFGVASLAGLTGDNKDAAIAMEKNLQDRYGSAEGFKRAIAEDPAGVMADMSVLAGNGASLARAGGAARTAGALGRVAEFSDPLSLMGKTAKAATYPVRKAAAALTGGGAGGATIAERLYGAAVKPSPALTLAERQNVIGTGIRERILPNQAGFDRLRTLKGNIADDVGNAVAGVDTPVDLERVLRAAQEQAGRIHGNTVAPSGAKAIIDNILSDFTDTYGGSPMSTARAQEIKQATYKAIEDAYGDVTGPEKEARKALARGLKDEIADKVPGVSDMNERLGQLSELSPVIEKAIGRTQNWNPVGLTPWVGSGSGAALGGAIGGPPGAAFGAWAGMAAAQAVRNPINLARLSFGLDAAGKAKAKIASALGAVPITRQQILYPAYVNRMREGD